MSRTPSGISEANLARLFRMANSGDPSALHALETLSSKDTNILQRFLPLLSRFLRAPLPHDCNLERKPYNQEVFAQISLGAIARLCTPEDRFLGPVALLVSAQISDVLRWMSYLFDVWVFQGWRYERIDPDSLPPHLGFNTGVQRLNILLCIPPALRKMSEHPVTCNLLHDHPETGSLLSQIFLASARDNKDVQFQTAALMYQQFGEEWKAKPSGLAFAQDLVLHSTDCAIVIISRIRQCSQPSPMDHLTKLYSLTLYLLNCTLIDATGTLLDACLQQAGIIRTLVSILRVMVDHLESDDASRANFYMHASMISTIICILNLAEASINRCGPYLTKTILDYGMLDIMLRLRAILAAGKISTVHIDGVVASCSLVINSILPFVIYPPVLRAALDFHGNYTHEKPQKATIFHESLEKLNSRIREEVEIVGVEIPKHHKLSQRYSSPYKFCDNAECPYTTTISKLGRCTECRSALYCSRFCQKNGWADGHRKECKEIVASTDDGSEGYPPVRRNHDSEYLNRTLAPRFLYYFRTNLKKPSPPVSVETVFKLDLVKFPVELVQTTFKELRSAKNPGVEFDDGMQGPLVVAKYPEAKKLIPIHDGFVVVSRLSPVWNPA